MNPLRARIIYRLRARTFRHFEPRFYQASRHIVRRICFFARESTIPQYGIVYDLRQRGIVTSTRGS